jgi:hypothetical protein
MATPMSLRLWAAAALVGLGFTATVQAQQASMTFFVTSVGKGDGANLGGLDGADAHCQALAKAAGATKTSWRAYLSTTAPGGDAGVSARDRIGKGPWQNAKGVVVAKSIDELHSASTNLDKQTALTEKGEVVSGRGDAVNMHDILTGSDPQGMFSTAGGDTTCGNWSKNGEGSAIVGHHDRMGLKDTWHMKSWNSSHGSRGCGQDALKGTGGAGLFYCFATD